MKQLLLLLIFDLRASKILLTFKNYTTAAAAAAYLLLILGHTKTLLSFKNETVAAASAVAAAAADFF